MSSDPVRGLPVIPDTFPSRNRDDRDGNHRPPNLLTVTITIPLKATPRLRRTIPIASWRTLRKKSSPRPHGGIITTPSRPGIPLIIKATRPNGSSCHPSPPPPPIPLMKPVMSELPRIIVHRRSIRLDPRLLLLRPRLLWKNSIPGIRIADSPFGRSNASNARRRNYAIRRRRRRGRPTVITRRMRMTDFNNSPTARRRTCRFRDPSPRPPAPRLPTRRGPVSSRGRLIPGLRRRRRIIIIRIIIIHVVRCHHHQHLPWR